MKRSVVQPDELSRWLYRSLSLKPLRLSRHRRHAPRCFATSANRFQDLESHASPEPPAPPPPPPPDTTSTWSKKEDVKLDPYTVSSRREERILIRQGTYPIGSRRRRAAIRTSQNIPFEQLPYQCFQEARKILQDDRQEKLQDIEKQRGRIERLSAKDVTDNGRLQGDAQRQALHQKEHRLKSMRKELERLKILADINDPMVKKRFEDGEGDMNRPIYRYLAKQKWHSYRYHVLTQRLQQMHVVPDLLPNLDITADISVQFGRHAAVQPGAFVPSYRSAQPPKLFIQPFDQGTRLVSIAIVDPDVPNVETDDFDSRCHFLGVNIPISPNDTKLSLSKLSTPASAEGVRLESQEKQPSEHAQSTTLVPWQPPYAQKGSPYHRLCVFVLQHSGNKPVNPSWAKKKLSESNDRFSLKSFSDRHSLYPVTAFLFRTQWDEGTDALMDKLGITGSQRMELKRKRVEPLPYKWAPKDGKRYR